MSSPWDLSRERSITVLLSLSAWRSRTASQKFCILCLSYSYARSWISNEDESRVWLLVRHLC
jgi:hypothetical protein